MEKREEEMKGKRRNMKTKARGDLIEETDE